VFAVIRGALKKHVVMHAKVSVMMLEDIGLDHWTFGRVTRTPVPEEPAVTPTMPGMKVRVQMIFLVTNV
jgi:hypothetical protein